MIQDRNLPCYYDIHQNRSEYLLLHTGAMVGSQVPSA